MIDTPSLFDLDEARAERDEAISAVTERAGEEWSAYAWEWLQDYLRHHRELFGDDVWEAGLARPHDMRALGGLVMRARRAGLIEATGRTRPRRSGHLTAAPVWRSRIWEGPA